jgi:DNA-binding CsgD family transcriptional regulator
MWRRPISTEGIVRWCATNNGSLALRQGVLDRLQALIPFDGAFFATTDPATLLYTGAIRRSLPAEASAAFIRTEFGEHDVNQLRDLARAPAPVGWLDAATRGDRRSSLRYREAMQPIGLGDELRVALRIDGWCWGLLCLHRAEAVAGFDHRDAALLGALTPHLAEGLRRAVVVDGAVADPTPDGPGVAVMGADGSLHAATPAAARWLDELAALDAPRIPELPTVVRGVVARLGDGVRDLLPRTRVRTPSGRWLVIHAAHLEGGGGSVAVVIEPADGAVLGPLIVAAYGLTAREAEVAQHVLTGLARKAIAAELRISLHTVNDHVKAIFDKTGVSSAGQLRTRVFGEHFLPRA